MRDIERIAERKGKEGKGWTKRGGREEKREKNKKRRKERKE